MSKPITMIMLLCLSGLLSLAGCSTLSEEECIAADWYQYGVADGSQGIRDRSKAHQKACEQYGIDSDIEEYQQGREEGLKQYCTYENGVAEGKKGSVYNDVCTGSAHEEFYSGYEPYYNITKTEEELSSYYYKARALERESKKDDITEEEQREILETLNQYSEEVDKLKSQLRAYEQDLEIHLLNREVDELKDKIE